MNAKVLMVIRILFGLFLLAMGLNKFLDFMPPVELSGDAATYMMAIMGSTTWKLIAVVEIAAGLAFILDKYAALLALVLMSVSLNVLFFHIGMDMANIAMGAALVVLNIVMLYAYRDKYSELLA